MIGHSSVKSCYNQVLTMVTEMVLNMALPWLHLQLSHVQLNPLLKPSVSSGSLLWYSSFCSLFSILTGHGVKSRDFWNQQNKRERKCQSSPFTGMSANKPMRWLEGALHQVLNHSEAYHCGRVQVSSLIYAMEIEVQMICKYFLFSEEWDNNNVITLKNFKHFIPMNSM